MTPASLPNTFPAPKWARVVQAVTWAEYGLNEEGRITEKSVRGPVIVWGRTSGEGEDLPRLEAPTPSSLELETARLNMRPHFLAFVRCAQGRGRNAHGKRVGFLCLWRGAGRRVNRSRVMRSPVFSPDACGFYLNRFHVSGIDPKYVFSKYQRRRYKRREAIEDRGGEALLDFELTEDFLCSLKHLEMKVANGEIVTPADLPGVSLGSLARILTGLFGDADLSGLVAHARKTRQAFPAILARRLQRAAFRAHIARRVRPVRRRSRIPRPLYARPRPPTCPLAPPL